MSRRRPAPIPAAAPAITCDCWPVVSVIRFNGRLEVDRSPGEVFALLADMATLDRWNPNVRDSRRVSGGRLEPGSRYESTIVRGPLRMTARSLLVKAEPGRSVQYEGTIGGFWSVDSLTFEPSSIGTQITFHNESRPPKWLRPFTPLLNLAFQPQARRAVEGARTYLMGLPTQ